MTPGDRSWAAWEPRCQWAAVWAARRGPSDSYSDYYQDAALALHRVLQKPHLVARPDAEFGKLVKTSLMRAAERSRQFVRRQSGVPAGMLDTEDSLAVPLIDLRVSVDIIRAVELELAFETAATMLSDLQLLIAACRLEDLSDAAVAEICVGDLGCTLPAAKTIVSRASQDMARIVRESGMEI